MIICITVKLMDIFSRGKWRKRSHELSFLNLYSDIVTVPPMNFSGESEQFTVSITLEGMENG